MPFGSLANLPKPAYFHYGNDTIYFAETYASQLSMNGTGIGTFHGIPGTAAEDVLEGGMAEMDKISSSTVQ